EDAAVVERQRDLLVVEVVDRPPARGARVAAGGGRGRVAGEGQVGDGHDPHAGGAVGVAVAGQLFEVGGRGDGRTSLLPQLAGGGLVEGLVGADEPAGQRPAPAMGVLGTLHEQHGQVPVTDGEHDDVDADGDR